MADKMLRERITDPNILWLVKRFLKAGVVEAGHYEATELGTPQGGIVSPILANIYLHYVLDLWFEKKFKPRSQGYMELVRYADGARRSAWRTVGENPTQTKSSQQFGTDHYVA